MRKFLSFFMAFIFCIQLMGCGNESKTNQKEESSKKDTDITVDFEEESSEVIVEKEPEVGERDYVAQIFNPVLEKNYSFKKIKEDVPMENGFFGSSYEFNKSDELPVTLTLIYESDKKVDLAIMECSWDSFPSVYSLDLSIALGLDCDPVKWINDIDSYGYVSEYTDGWDILIMPDIDTGEWMVSFDNGEWIAPGSEDESEEVEEAEVIEETEESKTNTTSSNFLSAGMYKVGVDIEPGIYYITAFDDRTAYWCINEDSAGSNILANEIVSTFGYFEVAEGEYLEISGGYAIPAEAAPIPEPASDGSYGDGHYLVGRDIPAGEYNVIAEELAFGYWCTSYDACTYDIDDNDLFEGNSYVTVYDGQYLAVSDAKLFPVN